ncbi:ATP-binding protein [bacterium]|nr:ATP-binding protein [bacterium]
MRAFCEVLPFLQDTAYLLSVNRSMQSPYCIMTVGLSHTGKTTLANLLIKKLPSMDLQHIETDTIRAMCSEYLPDIYR